MNVAQPVGTKTVLIHAIYIINLTSMPNTIGAVQDSATAEDKIRINDEWKLHNGERSEAPEWLRDFILKALNEQKKQIREEIEVIKQDFNGFDYANDNNTAEWINSAYQDALDKILQLPELTLKQ